MHTLPQNTLSTFILVLSLLHIVIKTKVRRVYHAYNCASFILHIHVKFSVCLDMSLEMFRVCHFAFIDPIRSCYDSSDTVCAC